MSVAHNAEPFQLRITFFRMTCSPSFCALLLFTHCDTAMLCRTCWYGGSGGLSSGGRVTRSLCSTAPAGPSSLTLPTPCAAPGMTCWPGMSCPSLPYPCTAFPLYCLCLSLPLPFTAFACHCLCTSLPLPVTAFALHCLCLSLPLPLIAFDLLCLCPSLPLPLTAFACHCLRPFLVLLSHCRCRGLTHAKEYAEEGLLLLLHCREYLLTLALLYPVHLSHSTSQSG